jgi:catechol 2,3-dioxygenase-like lactoylglutathione lyase family enzyme
MSGLPIRRLQFFTIRTKNLETARQFYVDRLGFPVMSEQAGEYFQVAIAGVPVCVDVSKDNQPAQPNQIGIEVTDLATTTATLRQKGFVVSEGSPVASTERWAAIHDPDGHELIFIAT